MTEYNKRVLKNVLEDMCEENDKAFLKEIEESKNEPRFANTKDSDKKIQKALNDSAKGIKKKHRKKAIIRVASVILVLLACVSVATLSVKGFREKIWEFLTNIGNPSYSLFVSSGDDDANKLSAYEGQYIPTWIPDGYEITSVGNNAYYKTIKFIKQLKLPIVVLRINGAYIAKPKWRKFQCKNKIRTDISLTLTKEEISNLSPEELNTMLNRAIAYNDFDYIKEKNLVYTFKNKAKGLENVLYYCPKCHKEHTFATNNNTIKCNSCGFELTIDDSYHFNTNEFNINNIHEWYELMKTYERSNIDKGINLTCNVTVKKFNFADSSLNEEGTGTCYLTNNEFKFKGDLKIKEFTHKIKDLKALAFSCGEEFECYYDNELYYFYPTENKPQCTKWSLIVDELQKLEENNEQ